MEDKMSSKKVFHCIFNKQWLYGFLSVVLPISFLFAQGCATTGASAIEKSTFCTEWTTGFYVRPSEWVVIQDRKGEQHIYNLNDELTRGNDNAGLKKKRFNLREQLEAQLASSEIRNRTNTPVWKNFFGRCSKIYHKASDIKFVANTTHYNLMVNGDMCSSEPDFRIYYTGETIVPLERYKKSINDSEDKFLTGFYYGWKNDSDVATEAAKQLMLHSCKSLPSSISVKAMLRKPIGYRNTAEQDEAYRKTATLYASRNHESRMRNRPLPEFIEIYSGKMRLIDIRKDTDKPINAFNDLHYVFTHDALAQRQYYIVKEVARLRGIYFRKAQREARKHQESMRIMSVFHGAMQGLTLNFSDEIMCSLDNNYQKCHNEFNQMLDEFKEDYSKQYKYGNFAGMLFTPTEMVYPDGFGDTPKGRAIMEAVEGALSEIGEAKSVREISFERMMVNMTTGAVVGAGVATLTGKGRRK